MNHAEQVTGAAPMGTAREMSCRWALREVDRGGGAQNGECKRAAGPHRARGGFKTGTLWEREQHRSHPGDLDWAVQSSQDWDGQGKRECKAQERGSRVATGQTWECYRGSSEMIVRSGCRARSRIKNSTTAEWQDWGYFRGVSSAGVGQQGAEQQGPDSREEPKDSRVQSSCLDCCLQHRHLLFCSPRPSSVQIAWTGWRRQQHPSSPGIYPPGQQDARSTDRHSQVLPWNEGRLQPGVYLV